MEEDRAPVDLSVAVDVEQRLEEAAAAQRQPKKRFVGRRQAEAASKNGPNSSVEDSGAIQGMRVMILPLLCCH
jgi:2-(3-amino-3-carboxypropyl)histidine synthase